MEDITWSWAEIQYNHVLSFVVHTWLIITRKFSPNCALLNMPEANYQMSDSKFETTQVTESYWTQPTSCLSWINTLLTMVFAAIPHTSLIIYNDPSHVGKMVCITDVLLRAEHCTLSSLHLAQVLFMLITGVISH